MSMVGWGIIIIVCLLALCSALIGIENSVNKRELKLLQNRYSSGDRLANEVHDYNCLVDEYKELISMGEKTYSDGKYDVVSHTGNMLVDSVFAYKKSQAEGRGIAVHIESENTAGSIWHIDDVDTISLLCNLLDNAMESAEQCQKPFIEIKVNGGSVWKLVFLNSCRESYNHMPLTTTKKDDRGHGFGVTVVEELVERYGGSVKWTPSGNVFRAELTLPGV